jgi:hypothetical protein
MHVKKLISPNPHSSIIINHYLLCMCKDENFCTNKVFIIVRASSY